MEENIVCNVGHGNDVRLVVMQGLGDFLGGFAIVGGQGIILELLSPYIRIVRA